VIIASVEGFLAKVFGKYPLITLPWVKHFLADWKYSIDKAKNDLGYSPRSLKQGIHQTINWLNTPKQ